MQFQHFDLNLLCSLDAFLTERIVTRASEILFVTQQSMSASLRRLREHFDDELPVRVGRNFELTPLASALENPVKSTLLSIQMALQAQSGPSSIRNPSSAISRSSIRLPTPRSKPKSAVG